MINCLQQVGVLRAFIPASSSISILPLVALVTVMLLAWLDRDPQSPDLDHRNHLRDN